MFPLLEVLRLVICLDLLYYIRNLFSYIHAFRRKLQSVNVQIDGLNRTPNSDKPSSLPHPDPTMAELVDSMLDLMRRLPPTRTEENVNALITICPDYADDLLGSVDQPLQLKTDRATGRDYLACDYNRDGESYRYV